MKSIFLIILILYSQHTGIAQTNDQRDKSVTNSSQTELRIGKSFGGGIIFYIDTTGMHGLVVAKTDLPQKAPYGCIEYEIHAVSQSDGTINTAIITKNCGDKAAAFQCSHLNIAGYKDWYLPSIDELALLFKAMLQPNLLSMGIYWSSTEYKWSKSCALDFIKGGRRITMQKDQEAYVRAIRKF